MKRIYMDHAATTSCDSEVLEAMKPFFVENFGNPSSLHSFGREAKKAINEAREKVAKLIGADPTEIVFTSGGTESNNFALQGIAFANALPAGRQERKNHIITSKIEHAAILETCKFLEKRGFQVTYLPVDKYGLVSPQDVEKFITDKTILVSIMHANNEIGTIEPIAEIAEIVKKKGIYFHTDAVQTVGQIPVNVNELKVDLLSASSHKFYGPKGVGFLYIRKGTKIHSYLHGGEQERGRRGSTENVPGIVGLGKAAEIGAREMGSRVKHLKSLRDKLIEGILEKIPDTKLNGHPEKRLPKNADFLVKYIEGESMLLKLDLSGVAVSTGSACSSGSLEPSHVLLACGIDKVDAHGSLRFTLGKDNTEEDIDFVLQEFLKIVSKLRELSPLYEKGVSQ